jgi:hypothetical protein
MRYLRSHFQSPKDSVIPANAGIHLDPAFAGRAAKWIPAFAGNPIRGITHP